MGTEHQRYPRAGEVNDCRVDKVDNHRMTGMDFIAFRGGGDVLGADETY